MRVHTRIAFRLPRATLLHRAKHRVSIFQYLKKRQTKLKSCSHSNGRPMEIQYVGCILHFRFIERTRHTLAVKNSSNIRVCSSGNHLRHIECMCTKIGGQKTDTQGSNKMYDLYAIWQKVANCQRFLSPHFVSVFILSFLYFAASAAAVQITTAPDYLYQISLKPFCCISMIGESWLVSEPKDEGTLSIQKRAIIHRWAIRLRGKRHNSKIY